ncbi:glutathione S-transferase family protein [Paraherbaspirillum soli]|uniref:Glutathione S-transferase family protein n=1 Tax=Paraherbaspirillum soli TaxID=631222 RepID=A0ABW0M6Q8_9BURK
MRDQLILHHYDGSPYSEKIRLLFGYKKLAWRSVAMPPILPKPDLMALTGGYRRAPVLQIGADIYCDSALIADEIEHRFAEPAVATGARSANADLLAHLVDVDLFWRAVRYVMGVRAEQIPQRLLDDRAAMHPHLHFDRGTLAADLPQVVAQLRPLLSTLDAALADADFIGGAMPALGDFAVYQPLWFLQTVDGINALAADCRHLHAWLARMAAFGHGSATPISAAETIAVSLQSTPIAIAADGSDPALPIGAQVAVTPENYPAEAVRGKLVHASRRRIVLARESDATGLVHVHFPRIGYSIAIASGSPAAASAKP